MNNSILSAQEFSEFYSFLEMQSSGDDISAVVAQEALQSELPEAFFNDLMNYGCISGMV